MQVYDFQLLTISATLSTLLLPHNLLSLLLSAYVTALLHSHLHFTFDLPIMHGLRPNCLNIFQLSSITPLQSGMTQHFPPTVEILSLFTPTSAVLLVTAI